VSLLDTELEQRVTALVARLRARLSPEDFQLVQELRQTEELAIMAVCFAEREQLLDAIVRHFPGQELAIRGILAHITATDANCDTLQGLPSGRHGR
jgi:hypothetical protein